VKYRRGFKQIIIDAVEYRYAVSLSTHKIVVYQGDQRFEWSLPEPCEVSSASWRGKNSDGAFGKREVAEIIRTNIGETTV